MPEQDLGTIFLTGTFDSETGVYDIVLQSPFLVAFSYVIIILFGLIGLYFFFKIWN